MNKNPFVIISLISFALVYNAPVAAHVALEKTNFGSFWEMRLAESDMRISEMTGPREPPRKASQVPWHGLDQQLKIHRALAASA